MGEFHDAVPTEKTPHNFPHITEKLCGKDW